MTSHPAPRKLETEEPGRALRRIRERLRLRYRDVEEASQEIARNRNNLQFAVGLSRLADIENRGTVPSIYRLYSLCAIYCLQFETALSWYGIEIDALAADASRLSLRETRPVDFTCSPHAVVQVPMQFQTSPDLEKTFYLTPSVQQWGRLPLSIVGSLDLEHNRYAFIGTEDWFMYPILAPGAFVQIDESKKRIVSGGWLYEQERPIYFLEHRNGYRCGWCSERQGMLIVQSHAASHAHPEVYRLPGEADIIGQVVGVAMRLDLARRRHIRS
jgi:transcriptional regulator with XRE-family HTH domain